MTDDQGGAGPATSDPPASTWLKPKLTGWANQMWARFGGAPVYLVGSALEKSKPRDVDLVIVVPTSTFHARYGTASGDPFSLNGPDWSPGMKRWYVEMAGLTRRLQPEVGAPLDVKIRSHDVDEPIWLHAQGKGRKRLRLDEFEDEGVSA